MGKDFGLFDNESWSDIKELLLPQTEGQLHCVPIIRHCGAIEVSLILNRRGGQRRSGKGKDGEGQAKRSDEGA